MLQDFETTYCFTFNLSILIYNMDALSPRRYLIPQIFSCESVDAPYYFCLIVMLTALPLALAIIVKFTASSLFHFSVLPHLTVNI